MLISALAMQSGRLGPFRAAGTPRFLYISLHFTSHLFRPWIPSSTRRQHFLSALGAFCLFEARGARICPGNLRYICPDNGNASQGADNTSVRAGGRFVGGNSAFSQQISTFYGPSVQAMETRLGARQRRRPPTVHRGRTHAPRLQRPVPRETYRATFGGALASRELWFGRSGSDRYLSLLWGLVPRVSGRIPSGASCPK